MRMRRKKLLLSVGKSEEKNTETITILDVSMEKTMTLNG